MPTPTGEGAGCNPAPEELRTAVLFVTGTPRRGPSSSLAAGVTARGYHDHLFLDRGLHAAYQDHANRVISKPLVPTELLATIRDIEDGWITIVRLPTRPG